MVSKTLVSNNTKMAFITIILAADQTQAMQDQMSGAAGAMPQDPKAAFKAEWEALEITEYQNALQNAENDLLQLVSSGSRNSNSIEH